MRVPGKSLLHAARHFVGLDPPHTQTTDRERNALAAHARGKRGAVEIGVYEGANTAVIADALCPDGVLYAIDPFFAGRIGISWGELIARREVERSLAAARVRFVKALSWDACRLLPGNFDFVFIDGDHSLEAVTRDWLDWSDRIERGGVIALHDTKALPDRPAVAEFGSARYFESHIRHDPRFELIEQVDSLAILRRV